MAVLPSANDWISRPLCAHSLVHLPMSPNPTARMTGPRNLGREEEERGRKGVWKSSTRMDASLLPAAPPPWLGRVTHCRSTFLSDQWGRGL
jgi:hypothetical protein